MKIETVKLTKLVPDDRNARLHNERNIAEIARSLHRCTPEEALELPPEPKDTNVEESFRNFRAGLDGRGLGFLLDGSRKLNEAAIKTRIK